MNTVNLVQGDSGLNLRVNLSRADGSSLNLSGASANLYVKKRKSKNLEFTIAGSVNSEDDYVIFSFNNNELDITPGEYFGEVEVSLSEGVVQTVYDLIKFNIRQEFA